MPFTIEPAGRCCSPPSLTHRHRPAVRAVPGAAQHAARSAVDAEGAGGSAVRRARRRAFRLVARHGADRAVDGAARGGRLLRQEPAQRQPRRSRPQDRQRDHVRPLAGAERLHAGAVARVLRAARGEARGHAGRHRRRPSRSCRCSRGSNWGNDVAVQGFQAGPDTDNNSRFNEVGPGYFRTLGMPLMAGTRVHRRRRTRRRRKSRSSTRSSSKKFNLGRDAVGKMMGTERGNGSKLDIRIVGVVQNAKYSEVKRRGPAAVLPAVPPGRTSRIRRGLRPHGRRSGAARVDDHRRRQGARSEPAGRGPEDDAAAGARQHLPRSDDEHAVGGVRDPRDAARRRRALRRARLHGVAADARDRPAHGARRGAVTRAHDGAAPGRLDDGDRRRDRAGGRVRPRPRRGSDPVRDQGIRSDRPGDGHRGAGRRRAVGRARFPRIARRGSIR